MSEETEGPPQNDQLFGALSKVLGDIKSVEQDGKNTSQNFSFVSMGNVSATLRRLLSKHGLVILTSVREIEETEIKSSRGNTGYRVRVSLRVVFAHESGQNFSVMTKGEGIDYGDKATGKAITSALKAALKATFLFYEGDSEDPDAHSPDVGARPEPPRNQRPPDAQQWTQDEWNRANRFLRGVISELDKVTQDRLIESVKAMVGKDSLTKVAPSAITDFAQRLNKADDLLEAAGLMIEKWLPEQGEA